MLCQAVSVYLLIGLIGASSYALLEFAAPGSFRFGDTGESRDTGDDRFERFLDYSFTTLTTLSYGNIAPASPRADALASLQAVVGQVYLAVVIARLVAIEVSQRFAGGVQNRPEE
ncbi:MAG: ion channel [Planctomycetota bacterium]